MMLRILHVYIAIWIKILLKTSIHVAITHTFYLGMTENTALVLIYEVR